MQRNVVLVFSFFVSAMMGSAASAQEESEIAPTEYVRICDMYGQGFYYIPGSEICVNSDTGETRKETEEGTEIGQTALAARVKILEEALKKLIQEK